MFCLLYFKIRQADQQQTQQRAQDNILQAVSLIAKQVQTNRQIGNVNNVNGTNTAAGVLGGQQQQQQQPTTTTNAIPQELTTMSDNDLLSYINPSCFDQGKYF